jgi:hypothetical protein
MGAAESEDEIDMDVESVLLSRIALYLVMIARGRNDDAGRDTEAGCLSIPWAFRTRLFDYSLPSIEIAPISQIDVPDVFSSSIAC